MPSRQSTDRKSIDKSKDFQLSTEMACADQRIATLSKEIKRLKGNQMEIVKNNEFMKSQVFSHSYFEVYLRLYMAYLVKVITS